MTDSRLQRAYDSARQWLREELPQAETHAAETLLVIQVEDFQL